MPDLDFPISCNKADQRNQTSSVLGKYYRQLQCVVEVVFYVYDLQFLRSSTQSIQVKSDLKDFGFVPKVKTSLEKVYPCPKNFVNSSTILSP